MKKLAMFYIRHYQNKSIVCIGWCKTILFCWWKCKDFIDEIHIISNGQLTCKQVAIYEDKQSNIREIILVSSKK